MNTSHRRVGMKSTRVQEKLTRIFLSFEKAACCHTVTAVSGGHIGLWHMDR